MSNADLYQALQMFQQGTQQAAIAGAVNDATAAMGDIHSGITKEADQRKALKQLSDQTALRLTGLGASGTQIQSAFNAIAPQNFGSVEQMQIEGDLSGSPLLQSTSTNILKRRQQAVMAEKQYEANLKMQLQQQEIAGKFGLQAQKAGLDKKELKTDEWKQLDATAASLTQGQDIMKSFNSLDKSTFFPRTGPGADIPGIETANPERAQFNMQVGQWFDQYRHAVTGAGAQASELAMLEKNVPSLKDNPNAFKAKLETALNIGQRVHERQLRTLKASGRDVAGWNQADQLQQLQQQQAKDQDAFMNQFMTTGK